MRFLLVESPFRNIHKFHEDDVLDYLDPRLREFAWQYHNQKQAAVPPCAFVFGETEGSFVLGFSHPTPGAFLEQVKYEVRHLQARRAVLLSEVNSVASPGDAALLAAEVQTPGGRTLRCAYDLLGPGRVPIYDDWTMHSVDSSELSRFKQGMDLIYDLTTQDTSPSRLLGLSLFFCPVFSNPSDSAYVSDSSRTDSGGA